MPNHKKIIKFFEELKTLTIWIDSWGFHIGTKNIKDKMIYIQKKEEIEEEGWKIFTQHYSNEISDKEFDEYLSSFTFDDGEDLDNVEYE